MIEIRAAVVVLPFLKMMTLSCEEEKELQIFSVSEVTELRSLDQDHFDAVSNVWYIPFAFECVQESPQLR